MIVSFDTFTPFIRHDICIVGAGPLGLAVALACADRGLKVLVLESGLEEPSPFYLELGRGFIKTEGTHAPLEEASCRCLGGTSHWWGGRCVPFDPIDFCSRPWVEHSNWPIEYSDIAPWYSAAAAYFGCGPPVFSLEGPWRDLIGLQFESLERWAPDVNMARVHRNILTRSQNIVIVLGATVTKLHFSPDKQSVVALTARNADKSMVIETPRLVLACGGVQTTRLLLVVQREFPALFGGRDGSLGRYYMGHIFGKISDIIMNHPEQAEWTDFFVHEGAYVRRRFTIPDQIQACNQLPQIIFSVGNAPAFDPSHKNGALSLIWLLLSSPLGKHLLPGSLRKLYVGEADGRYMAHIANILKTIPSTAIAACKIFAEQYLQTPAKPAIVLLNSGGRYAVFYHAEQSPCSENRISLAEDCDAFGMPRVEINFKFSDADAASIVRAHGVFQAGLQANGIARLELRDDGEPARVRSVLRQARDGYHQIGAARMSLDPHAGVVDRNCQVHGVSNLFVASTCVFPSSGHANPTFLGVALSLRLAEHIASLNR